MRPWKKFARELRTAEGFHRFRPDLQTIGGTITKASRMRGLVMFLGQTESQEMELAGHASDEDATALHQYRASKKESKKGEAPADESGEDAPRKVAKTSKKQSKKREAPQSEHDSKLDSDPNREITRGGWRAVIGSPRQHNTAFESPEKDGDEMFLECKSFQVTRV